MSISDIKLIKKNSIQHDIYNRLHSIAHDIHFIQSVAKEWYEGKYLVVANQRCGLWYCPPDINNARSSNKDRGTAIDDVYAYFKSTDGHTNNWNLNLRRANLHLVKIAEDNGGIILVDSTRRGKRMPDALSKTIPIWCCVINRAVAIKYSKTIQTQEEEGWNTNLYVPPSIVTPSEKAQIEGLLDGWVHSLLDSSLTLPNLSIPLRPIFITPSTTTPPFLKSKETQSFIPIICLSASEFIPGSGGPVHYKTRSRSSQTQGQGQGSTFEYVQGSGDDDELWGKGLKPYMFFAENHYERILGAEREEVGEVVEGIVSRYRNGNGNVQSREGDVGEVDEEGKSAAVGGLSRPSGFGIPEERLWLGILKGTLPAGFRADPANLIISIHTSQPPTPPSSVAAKPAELEFIIPEGKKGQLLYLIHLLPTAIKAAEEAIEKGGNVLVRDEDGKDMGVGLMVGLLWVLLDGEGRVREGGEGVVPKATKSDLQTRLQWILDKRPGTNPSRTTLKRTNEYLMSPPRK